MLVGLQGREASGIEPSKKGEGDSIVRLYGCTDRPYVKKFKIKFPLRRVTVFFLRFAEPQNHACFCRRHRDPLSRKVIKKMLHTPFSPPHRFYYPQG